MQRMTDQTLPDVVARLSARAHHAMFPLSNLQEHGLHGDDPRTPALWADDAAVLTVTKEGMAMPFGPPASATAMARQIEGMSLIGVIGEVSVARALMAEAGLADAPVKLDADEPQFLSDLDDLTVPDGPGTLVPLAESDRATYVSWSTAYDVEALGSTEAEARDEAVANWTRYTARGSYHVLTVDGLPAAMTGLNARAGDIVQVGGVYTPPASRNRGLARRAVALDLARERDAGTRRATLFASGPAAVRAYEAIGFDRIGDFCLTLFDGPQVARA